LFETSSTELVAEVTESAKATWKKRGIGYYIPYLLEQLRNNRASLFTVFNRNFTNSFQVWWQNGRALWCRTGECSLY